jgi:hypothetical protein
MEFVFPFTPSPNVPRGFVYRKSRPVDVAVASPAGFMDADTQASLQRLKPGQVEECCEAAVIITELDDGTAEWRVELRRHSCLLPDPRAPDTWHVHHGYINGSALFAQGVNHRAFARQMATQALAEHHLAT